MNSTFVMYISITIDLIFKFRDEICIVNDVNVLCNTKTNLTVISMHFHLFEST